MPSTLRHSQPKAQRTWIKTHDAAAKQYGDGERAHRTAYAALKQSYERRGDHWVRPNVRWRRLLRSLET